MSAEDVELVRRAWQTMVDRDPAGLDYLAEDFEWHQAPESMPDADVYRGRDGYIQAVRNWAEAWRDWHQHPIEYIDGGPGRVMVVSRATGRSRHTDVAFEGDSYWVYEVRDAKIRRIHQFADRPAAFHVLANLGDQADLPPTTPDR